MPVVSKCCSFISLDIFLVSDGIHLRCYEVVVDGAVIACRCTAGLRGRACKHAALVRVLDASGAVPVPEPRPAAGPSYAALFGGGD